jgi:hypothetical protein
MERVALKMALENLVWWHSSDTKLLLISACTQQYTEFEDFKLQLYTRPFTYRHLLVIYSTPKGCSIALY